MEHPNGADIAHQLVHGGEIALQLAGGAAGGVLGAIVREFQRTDREFSWALVPKIISAGCAGSVALTMAAAVGIENDYARLFCAMAVGMTGSAWLIDTARRWLRVTLNTPASDPAAEGGTAGAGGKEGRP